MKSDKKIIIILSFVCLLLIINSFINKIFNNFGICALLAICLALCIYLFGLRRPKNRYEKDIILSIIIYVLLYYVITYLSGLIFGFNRTIYDNSFIGILNNVIPIIITIVLSELLRYVINIKFKDNIIVLILSAVMFTLVDTTFIFNAINYSDLKSIIDNFGLFIIPSITTNIFLTYTSYKFGYKVNILYRLLMEIPIYIVSLMPAFGEYIESIIYSCFPLLVFYLLYKNYNDNKNIIKVETGVSANIKKIVRIILIIFMIGIVMLTSGLFKYKTIVIASGSMEPIIYRGDISIIRKLSDSEKERLTEGEIIVFKMDGKIVIHRINGIIKSGNDIFYRTKGDNNDTVDNYLIEKQDIIAVSKCIIKYIGYLSLWLSEMW